MLPQPPLQLEAISIFICWGREVVHRISYGGYVGRQDDKRTVLRLKYLLLLHNLSKNYAKII
jgi:hypothetical protein